MRKSLIGLSALALMGMGSLGTLGSGTYTVGAEPVAKAFEQSKSQPAERNKLPSHSPLAAFFGSGTYRTRRDQRRAGFGWTNAHAKRVARKARALKRHRATSKG
jgi:hypothetical protein